MSEVTMIKLSKLKKNPENPRMIIDERFDKLKANIEKYPKFLEARPIVIKSFQEPIVLGGNMRLRALRELGYKEIPSSWVKEAKDYTQDEINAFIILDNVGFGEWDIDKLEGWSQEELESWGLILEEFEDYSDKNKEISNQDLKDSMMITLKYTEAEYNKVKAQLLEIARTPEQAVWKLLGNS